MICFCVNLAHARAVFEAYCAAGVSAAFIEGKTPDGTNPNEEDERSEIKKGLESGKYEVVVNCQVLQVGSDWPFVDCIQLARPTRSEMLYCQIIGRGLRDHPGKKMLRILDHTDAWRRLGRVDAIHYEKLDDGSGIKCSPRPKAEEAQPKECPQCNFVKPPRTATCLECGFHAQVQSKVVTVDGTLEKVTEGKPKYTTEEKQATYEMMRGYYLGRGQNADQAYWRFYDMFKHYPHGYEKKHRQPNAKVISWLKGQAARRAIAQAAIARKNQTNAGAAR
jgi:superfamily II DNA or RNA helicase